MPEAIATTKRKFHRLLDSLTNHNNAQALPTEYTTPLTAREKLDQASERVRKRQRQDGSRSSIDSRLAQHTTMSPSQRTNTTPSSKTSPQKDRAPPNFSPWSQETFLQRLHTFSRVSLWHPKPDGINEVAWAKRGWQCVDVNTVACQGGCGRRVVVKLDASARKVDEDEEEELEDEEDNLEQALVARYQTQIVEGHSDICLWRKAGCKDDIYRLQVVRPAAWQPALTERYNSLLEIAVSIQHVTIQKPHEMASPQLSPERIRAELPEEILPTSEVAEVAQICALDIAMHGWRGTSELNADLMNCDACFQRIGLWMYQPGYRSRAAPDNTASLDLLEMHREYCPWRSADTQQASGTLAGLNASEVLFKVVNTYIKERRRKTEEQIASPDVAGLPYPFVDTPKPSRAEVEEADRERESRLQKLKRLLSIKRPSKGLINKT